MADSDSIDPRSADLCTLRSRIQERFASSVAGKKFILAVGPAGAALPWVKDLLGLGSAGVLVLAFGPDPGVVFPPGVDCVVLSNGECSTSGLAGMEQYRALLLDPSRSALARIRSFDPQANAEAVVTELLDVTEIAGRRRLGPPPPGSREWELKTAAEPFWKLLPSAGPFTTVVDSQDESSLGQVFASLDQGCGVVLSSDPQRGVGFGCSLVRHVQRPAMLAEAVCFFQQNGCRLLRAMSFVSGVHCSIHGFVVPRGVAVFRPVEQVILREIGSSRFLYGGVATYWSPSDVETEIMREWALATGLGLMTACGYLGAFGIDGVLSSRGFIPIELNARMSAGLALLGGTCRWMRLPLLHLATRDGADWDLRPDLLEVVINQAADQNRCGAAYIEVDASCGEPRQIHIIGSPDGWRRANDERSDACLRAEPGGRSTGLWLLPIRGRMPVGPEFAPVVPSALNLAGELGLVAPRLEAASRVGDSRLD